MPTPTLTDTLTRWKYKPWGLLDSIVDPRRQGYGFSFDQQGRLAAISLPNGVTRAYEYTVDGALGQVRVHTRYNEDFPYGMARHWVMRHDSRGKLTRSLDRKQIPDDAVNAVHEMHVQAYAPGGALISSDHVRCDIICRQSGFPNQDDGGWLYSRKEKMHPDPLGRMLWKAQMTGESVWQDTLAYDWSTGRTRAMAYRYGDRWYWSYDNVYDASGNLTRSHRHRTVGGCSTGINNCGDVEQSSYRVDEVYAHYYDMADRLRFVDHAVSDPYGNVRAGIEEFRYDALGRRVLSWFRNDHVAGTVNNSRIRRYVHDGEQVLYEITAPGNDSLRLTPEGQEVLERDQENLNGDYPYEAGQHGTVLNVHGVALDQPIAVIKVSMLWSNNSGRGFTVFPHEAWNGSFDQGTLESGYLDGGYQNTDAPLVCWEERRMTVEWDFVRPRNFDCPRWAFWGSLLDKDRSGTGLNYHRNRFFDPTTGAFTQEDPIGLAGGKNLYGFGEGDHVNYSDPFGLCADGFTTLACLYAAFEVASGAYDVYDTFKAYRRSSSEGAASLRATFMGAFAPGPGNAYRKVADRLTGELGALEAKFANVTKELAKHNHFQKARLEKTNRSNSRSDHAEELRHFANGLRTSADRLKRIIGSDAIDDATRERAQELLSQVSTLRDRMTRIIGP